MRGADLSGREADRSGGGPIRRCTVLDLDEMLNIAVGCYPPFNQQKALAWAERVMLDPNHGFFRANDCWGCTVLTAFFFEDRPRALMLFLAGRPGAAWQAVQTLATMIAWGQRLGASSYTFGEDTGMRMDVLARRLKAKFPGLEATRPSFRIHFPSASVPQPEPQPAPTSRVAFWQPKAA